MSPRSATPTLPLLDTDQVARLRRWLDEGADIFEALGGGAAAWRACRARGAGLRRLDLVLEHMERSSRVTRCLERSDPEPAGGMVRVLPGQSCRRVATARDPSSHSGFPCSRTDGG